MKNNSILVGIIISLLLLTLPAATSDCTLDIFGNANEDDTINMQDVTYTELIILEFKDQTQLADAKYDGEIDILDVTQIELIILGREKEMTIADNGGRIVTINKPADKMVCFYRTSEHLVAIGAKDTIVGAEITFISQYMPEIFEGADLADVPHIGTRNEPNYEKILELMPDLVICPYRAYNPEVVEEMATHLPDVIPVAGMDFYLTIGESRYSNLRMLGYIVDKRNEVEELIDWMQRYEDTLLERTNDLNSEEKPTVLSLTSTGNVQTTAHGAGMIEIYGGGRNLAHEIVPPDATSVEVSNEWILEKNPDVIFVSCSLGWNTNTEDAQALLEEFIDKPGWDKLSAVVNNRVYLIDWSTSINRYMIGGCFFGKCIHPELFEDINPEEINREYFEQFLGYEVQGVWMYPAAS